MTAHKRRHTTQPFALCKLSYGKGVTYTNLIPNIESDFYKEFIDSLTGYPTTYIVDSEGNIIGAPLLGVVSGQEEKMMDRIDSILEKK